MTFLIISTFYAYDSSVNSEFIIGKRNYVKMKMLKKLKCAATETKNLTDVTEK